MLVPEEFHHQVECLGIYIELVVRGVADVFHCCAVLVLADLPLWSAFPFSINTCQRVGLENFIDSRRYLVLPLTSGALGLRRCRRP